MILKTEKRQVDLIIKTRSIIQIADVLNTKNFEAGFIKAYNSCDIEALARIIEIIGVDTKGEKAFNNLDEVYNFLDELRKEKIISYAVLYSKIAEVLNEEGFFKKKMTEEELKEMISNPLSEIDIQETISKILKEKLGEQISQNIQA